MEHGFEKGAIVKLRYPSEWRMALDIFTELPDLRKVKSLWAFIFLASKIVITYRHTKSLITRLFFWMYLK